ncbi:MAG: hypothetical protein SOW00_00605 [Oscillospiraceae bacterium]|nr:hypothetical protein [Oscillospiraceae bacterium]
MRASKRSSATLERQGQERGGGSPFALQRAGDKNASQTLFERICAPYGFVFLLSQKNNIRIQRSQAALVFRAAALKRFWALLAVQKCRPAGRRTSQKLL